jgi:hypothetical protein
VSIAEGNMPTTFYIHIGVPKTGSKSIQYTMSENREALLASGINYLEVDRNHGPFLISLLSDEPHKNPHNIRKLVDTPEKAASYNAANRERLTKALAENRSPKFVISGEGFSGMPPRLVPQLKEMLEPYAAAYRIIVYVRDPYEYVNSAFLQHVKSGRTLETNFVAVPGYRSRIGKYIALFGRENVDIRVFDPAQFAGGDLVSDFLAALGEPASLAGSLKIERANQSMSHEAAAILSEANKAIPTRIGGLANRGRASTFHLHLSDIKGEKFWLDPDLYLQREEEVLDDLAWLNRTLGQTTLEKPVPRPASAARWSDATIRSIKEAVSGMAKTIEALRRKPPRRPVGSVVQRFRKEEKDFSQALPTDLRRVELPSNLRWLAEAIGQPASGVKPQFDQATIRDLAVFLHSMALTIERLQAGQGVEPAGFFGRLLARAR